jgi:hypothetical protein
MARPRIPPIDRLRPDLPRPICDALGLALRANADERIGARDMLEVLRGYVKSTEARAALADGLARARRRPTFPDAAPPRAWTAYAAAIDPDRISETSFSTIAYLPDTASGLDADSTLEPATTPTAPLAESQRDRAVTRERFTSDTPTAIVSHDELFPPVRAEPRRPGRWLALCGSIAAALAAGLAVVIAGSARTRENPPGASSGPGPSCTATMRTARSFVPSPPRERVIPRGRTEWVDPDPVDTGLLDTPSAMWNHRVFVDGLTRGAGGDVIRLRCGRHTVRLGSAGRVQSVDVPCGGTVAITR